MDEDRAKALPRTAAENIGMVKRMREEAREARSAYERLLDAVGSSIGRLSFIVAHLVWFLAWAAFNTQLVPGLPVFDPYPFSLFGTLVSFEALVITALVLMKQNRMSLRDERRSHVELQMTLLAEKEITHLIRMTEAVMGRLGLEVEADVQTEDLREHTAVEEIARAVHESLPE